MIAQARERQQRLGLTNLTWIVGDAQPLPFAASFSRVITRYSFHHFTEPGTVFAEMVRVCCPGGRVTVVDVYTRSAEQARAYDQLEMLRDPSHTHALQLDELESLFAKLGEVRREFYPYPVMVDELLARSFPEPGGAEAFRKAVQEDIGVNGIGIRASDQGGLGFEFPVLIFSGTK
jgi:SAM-dependent methyltransferase